MTDQKQNRERCDSKRLIGDSQTKAGANDSPTQSRADDTKYKSRPTQSKIALKREPTTMREPKATAQGEYRHKARADYRHKARESQRTNRIKKQVRQKAQREIPWQERKVRRRPGNACKSCKRRFLFPFGCSTRPTRRGRCPNTYFHTRWFLPMPFN